MNFRVGLVLAIGSALVACAAFAAQPAAGPTTPPAAPPAAPAAAEAPKANDILLTTPPAADNIASGKVAFAAAAFPIVVDAREADIQRLLGQAHPISCRTCRGTGKVTHKEALGQRLDGKALKPVSNTYDETCPDCRCEALKCPTTCSHMFSGSHNSCESCGGKSVACPALQLPDHCCGSCCVMRGQHFPLTRCPGNCCGRLTHEPTCTKCQVCNSLRALRAAHARTQACDACRPGSACSRLRLGHGSMVKPEQMPVIMEAVKALAHLKHSGDRWPILRQAITAKFTAIAEAHAERLLGAAWGQTRIQAPCGQPAIVIGPVQAVSVPPGLLQYARIDNEQGALQAILVGAEPTEPLPSGRVMVGGLIVGRWQADSALAGGVQEAPVILVSAFAPAPGAP